VFAAEEPSTGDLEASTWEAPTRKLQGWPAEIPFRRYEGRAEQFVADAESEPTVEKVTTTLDDKGDRWIMLDGFVQQADPNAIRGWQGLQQRVWVSSWLLPTGQAALAAGQIAAAGGDAWFDFEDNNGHIDCCYLREVGANGLKCGHRHEALSLVEIEGEPFELVASSEDYLWEGNILDCSLIEAANLTLPSTYLQNRSMVRFSAEGPSWRTSDGQVAYMYSRDPNQKSHGLWGSERELASLLKRERQELLILLRWERLTLAGDFSSRSNPEPYSRGAEVAWLGSDLAAHPSAVYRKVGHLEPDDV
jgi:hypothetical protein